MLPAAVAVALMVVRLGLVGCGGISVRHVDALRTLRELGGQSFELTAVCDLRPRPAERVARCAAEWLGHEPAIFGDVGALLAAGMVEALDVTTDAGSHHLVAIPALERGVHVLVEKPLAVTVRAGRRMLEAAQRGGAVLSVAENYRRDPVMRLIKAAIDSGVIGAPRLAYAVGISGTDRIALGTSWRHDRLRGGVLLDSMVHIADLLLYFLGDVERVYAETGILEPHRRMVEGEAGVNAWLYEHREDEVAPGETMVATAADTALGVLRFRSGALGYLGSTSGAPGRSLGGQVVYGGCGSISLPPARSGRAPEVLLRDERTPRDGNWLLTQMPGFALDALTQRLFDGHARLGSYEIPIDVVNARLVAYQLEEFATCMRSGVAPEVDGEMGLHAMAVPLALLESGATGRPVRLDDVLSLGEETYQAAINTHLGID